MKLPSKQMVVFFSVNHKHFSRGESWALDMSYSLPEGYPIALSLHVAEGGVLDELGRKGLTARFICFFPTLKMPCARM